MKLFQRGRPRRVRGKKKEVFPPGAVLYRSLLKFPVSAKRQGKSLQIKPVSVCEREMIQ